MRSIALFNNKGGVGKSTLAFHAGYALNELGHRTLLIDLDPQCNLTIFGIDEEHLHRIWHEENDFIEDFYQSLQDSAKSDLGKLLSNPRSIHFILKPTEDGISDFDVLPPPIRLADNLDLIPGRLSLHLYENKIAERWNGAYQGDNLSIRTLTKIREICQEYGKSRGYDYIIIDTSPSLGIMNKTIISTVDGFVIPAQPDMFSLYGIRNIGNSLTRWQKEFETIYTLISSEKRTKFPEHFVQFLGYTIYNAKPYAGLNEYDLSRAHYDYVKKIPDTISTFITKNLRDHLSTNMVSQPIGGKSVMHTHNTLPSMAQKFNSPIWLVPSVFRDKETDSTLIASISGNKQIYEATRDKYHAFANGLIERINTLP